METVMTTRLTVEEALYVATVLDNSNIKTRLAVISNMEFATYGNIISGEDKLFIETCLSKLQQMSDKDFGNINFFSACMLDADEQNEEDL